MTRISLAVALVVPVVNFGTILWGQEVYDIFPKGLVQERVPKAIPRKPLSFISKFLSSAVPN